MAAEAILSISEPCSMELRFDALRNLENGLS